MSDLLPEARRIKRRLPGLVWAIPAAALIVVGYLGISALAEHGVEVVLVVDDAGGAKRRDTPVTYKGVNVGKVTHIELSDDREHAELTLELSRKVEPLLTSGTRFWLVGSNPTLEDLSSLTAAVTGTSIEMAPGPGTPQRRFSGLAHAPIILPGTPGTRIYLETDNRGSLKPGTRVSYHGDDAGKVTGVRFVPPAQFEIEAFITAPYSEQLRSASGFWTSGGVQVQLTLNGVSTNLPNASDLFSGGIAFDTPAAAIHESSAIEDGWRFHLYTDEATAREGADGPDILYEAAFDSATGGLAPGAPVTLLGFRVGRVRVRDLVVDAANNTVRNPVILALHPQRLGLDTTSRDACDAFIKHLVELGYELRLVQSPPIVGATTIEIAKVNERGKVSAGTAYPLLPTTTTGDIASLTAMAGDILHKVDKVPFERIGNDVATTTEELNKVLASVEPEIGPTMQKLRDTSDQLAATAASANQIMTGDGASQDTSLPGAIRQFTDAARAIRAFADYMERHPEALLFGKPKEHQ